MKYLSLFSGIGGFELGIKQAYEDISNQQSTEVKQDRERRNRTADKMGNDVLSTGWTTPLCVGYSEIDKYATQIYDKHFKHKNYGDITKINPEDLEDFDLLVGGFPCQAFSIAGKRGGFDDTRGTLFFEIARIIREKQPRLLLLENVKGLLSHDKGNTFTTIISTLDELGYDIQWQVLNSKNFGVPQNRERVFIIGHLRGTSRPEVFPIGESNKQLHEKCIQKSSGGSPQPEWRVSDSEGARRKILGSSKIRRLTPKECERLQGFPDDWTEGISDTQRYKCCGNAVTVNVIKEIIKKLCKL